MAVYYSTNLKIALPDDGTTPWGTYVRTNYGDTTTQSSGVLEQAISGYYNAASIFTSDADVTLTIPNGYDNTTPLAIARNMYLEVTSSVSLTATRNLIVPTNRKLYFIYNNTTGGQSIVVKTASGTGVTVANGARVAVVSNGTNIVPAVTALSGNLIFGPVASGYSLTVSDTIGTPFQITSSYVGASVNLIQNTNTGATIASTTRLATGTTNATADSSMVDNAGVPYYQFSAGAAVQSYQWRFGTLLAGQVSKTGNWSIGFAASSTSVTGTSGATTVTTGGTVTGTFAVGQSVIGLGIGTGAVITAISGSTLTLSVANLAAISSTPITAYNPLTYSTTLNVQGSGSGALVALSDIANTNGAIVQFNGYSTAVASATTATGSSGTNTIITGGTITGTFVIGQSLTGTGIGAGALITNISGTTPNFTLTLSVNNTANISGTSVTATTPSKYVRMVNGTLQVLNNSFSTPLFQIKDTGIHSTQVADAAGTLFNAGFLEIPVNNFSTANYTTALADSGKEIYYTGSNTASSSGSSGASGTNTITTSGTITGTFAIGQTISGTGVATGAIISNISGTTPSFTLTLTNAAGAAANNTSTVSGVIAASPTVVIAANAVSYPVGTAIMVMNNSSGTSNLIVQVATDALLQIGTGSTGLRTIAKYGEALIKKVASGQWTISGLGIT